MGSKDEATCLASAEPRPIPNPLGTRLATRVSAAAPISWSGQDGAIAWATYSAYPREAGIAGRRFAAYMDRLPLPALWYAVAEAASEGHHAAGALIEPYLRSRCARIGETLRDMEKSEDRIEVSRNIHALDVSAFLAKLRGVA